MNPTPPADFVAFLQSQRDRYRRELPQKIAELEQAWAGLASGAADADRLTHLQRLAHNLAGSSGTFGFPELGAVARELESCLRRLVADADLCDPARREHINVAISKLRQAAPAEGTS